MELSVVVPTYNQAALLRECLTRLLAQSLAPEAYEVIVVDDGSPDDTPEVVRAAGPRVRHIRFQTNRGRSAARNAGIEQARSPVIVFIDSDVMVRPSFLRAHLAMHRRHGPRTLSRGPVVLVPSVDAAAEAGVPRLAASPAYLDTANAGVGKQQLQRAGMFDEQFPGYGWEDFELGMRLRHLGVRRVFSREAAAFHVQPSPDPDDVEALLRKEEARARSAAYFYRKAPGLRTRLLIQSTALHRAVYWAMAAGGALSARGAARLARGLERRGMPGLAQVALRSGLNRHYLIHLGRELDRHHAALA